MKRLLCRILGHRALNRRNSCQVCVRCHSWFIPRRVLTPHGPLLLAALLLPSVASAQRAVPVSSWVTELGAGAGTDLFARGPWINPTWRRSIVGRVTIATGLSLVYEYGVEPWNGYSNAAKWQDAAQRLVGTIAAELVIAAARKVF